ncbi:killer cell immunoglobulin-like receptor 3DL1 [Peromyscus maniculatus bairdii]|uniref:killer cell immunoglobulin-like receptor 3DL1 n=1 Tax=Peromyscus maniculatus bairdii TaxID=230844 RepID=UPI003FD2CFE2
MGDDQEAKTLELSAQLAGSPTGSHDKPSLSAWPSHIVPLGQRVELRCDSHSVYYTFKLYKELGNPIPHIQGRPFQRKFVFEPVTTEYAGTYRCYGFNDRYPFKISANSDPVKIIISGVYRKPFLLALQPPLVNLGETVTLECRSEIMFDTFILTSYKNGTIKDSFELSAEHYHGGSQANFSIGPVTPDDAGTYTCYGSLNHSPYEWSESSGPIDINITGLYKIPTLSALMGPGVMSGENMTLTCFSDLQFDMFHLSREGVPEGHELPSVQNNNGTFQANFLLGPVVQAGNYRCYGSFRNSSHLWSTPTDPLYILVTGSHDKPSLSACPSHIVPLGQRVELRCDSHSVYYTFKLYKELGNPIPHIHGRPFQRKFVFEPVTTEHAGTYRCYGFNDHYPIKISANSDPVKIIISGIYRKPFLLALQPPLVNLGEKVTLECRSEIMFDTFILTSHKNGTIKESFKLSAEHYHGVSQANFSIGPVTPDDAGTYTCYGSYNHTPYEWSESDDPIDIKITGLYKKPFLSALMGPVVMSGENMTLTCFSDLQFDMFHLSRTGVPKLHGLPSVQNHSGTFQASFHLGPVVQAGNYRCYGSFRNSSHLWSTPSDPLYILVTDNLRNLHILIGLSVTMILAFLIILLYSWCSAKKSKSLDQASELRATLNRQDPEREEVQEVTYLKFDQMIFKQKLTIPDSQIPKEFSTDPSLYMEVRKC